MVDAKDNFREAVERLVWSHSNLDSGERADVLREYADALDGDESRFDDSGEHVRTVLRDLGYRLPEDGNE